MRVDLPPGAAETEGLSGDAGEVSTGTTLMIAPADVASFSIGGSGEAGEQAVLVGGA